MAPAARQRPGAWPHRWRVGKMQRDTGAGAPQAHSGPDLAKLAVIYPRQSSLEQVRENVQSTARQMALREQAIAHGFPPERVLVVVDDLGLSGRTIAGRPGFSRILAMMREGLVGALYVEDLTRLSRDDRTVDQMLIASECEAAGVPLWMGGTWYDLTESGSRQAFKYQAVGFSETWRAHLAKAHAAQMAKASKGRLATGSIPRGYRPKQDVPKSHPERDRLVVFEPEAEIIRGLAEAVLRVGSIRGAYKATHPVRWPDGSLLTFRKLMHLMTAPVYRGAYAFAGQVVDGAHEAIFPPELAAELDRLRGVNRSTLKRSRTSEGGPGVLSGLMRCACGRKVSTTANNGAPAYCCRQHCPEVVGGYHWLMGAAVPDEVVVGALWAQLGQGLALAIAHAIQGERALAAKVADLGAGTRKALERRIEGLVSSLADPDLGEGGRKRLLAALEAAEAELAQVEAAAVAATKPGLAADASFFEGFARQPEALATLQATWEQEPLGWRRGWLRRFVVGVVASPEPEGLALQVNWRDGQRQDLLAPMRRHIQPEELAAALALWGSPERPRLAWGAWLAERLVGLGFPRRAPQQATRMVRLAKGAPKTPPSQKRSNAKTRSGRGKAL